MSKIRSKNTKPEVYIRSALFKRNYRFRVNHNGVEGCPDIYFTRKKAAIFVHGCYWHRHDNCKYAYTPKSNLDFWLAKFEANKKRDAAVCDTLLDGGARVLIIWECTVKKIKSDPESYNDVMMRIDDFILNENEKFLEI